MDCFQLELTGLVHEDRLNSMQRRTAQAVLPKTSTVQELFAVAAQKFGCSEGYALRLSVNGNEIDPEDQSTLVEICPSMQNVIALLTAVTSQPGLVQLPIASSPDDNAVVLTMRTLNQTTLVPAPMSQMPNVTRDDRCNGCGRGDVHCRCGGPRSSWGSSGDGDY